MGEGVNVTRSMEYIDLAKFPLDKLGSSAAADIIHQCRENLKRDGVCILEGFLTPEAVKSVLGCSLPLLPLKHQMGGQITPYFGEDEDKYPAGHSRTTHMDRDYGFIPADRINDDHPLATIYTTPEIRLFLQEVLERPMYLYEDPFQTINLKVEEHGGRQPFHFDSADGTITIMLQNATSGGEIEAVPNALGNEEVIQKALHGNFDNVHKITYRYKPGTLVLFNGTTCLHRVLECTGPTQRVIGIYQYAKVPNQKACDKKSAMLYGPRVAEKIRNGEAKPRQFGSSTRTGKQHIDVSSLEQQEQALAPAQVSASRHTRSKL